MSEIFGIYDKQFFRNEQDGTTLFALRVSDKTKERNRFGAITCLAKTIPYRKGTPLYVKGTWEAGSKGKILKVQEIWEEAWNIASAAEFLASDICKGIGYAKARAIVSKIGPDIFRSMQQDGAEKRISNVIGVTEEQAKILCDAVKSTAVQRELFECIIRYGGFYSTVTKLIHKYGAGAKEALFSNPYQVGMEGGLSFRQCDEIAKDHGFSAASLCRLQACANAAIDQVAKAGNTYIQTDGLFFMMQKVLDNGVFAADEAPSASMLVSGVYENEKIVIEEGLVDRAYPKILYYAEKNAAFHLARLIRTAVEYPFDDSVIDYAQQVSGVEYAPQQKECFNLLRKSGVAIVTGGPGTGKTTTINGLLLAYQKMHPDKTIRLCAPTGRAAQRMAESTGMEATTIHRLLEYQPYGTDVIHKDENNPIAADCIVVDESSMIDVLLFSILLSAIPSGALLLLVGDSNQLPSVGAGDVLHDLLLSDIPSVRLTTVYRQAETSPIVGNANKINDGEMNLVKADDFRVRYTDQAEKIGDLILNQVQALYDPEYPFDVQVLSPTKKGSAGTFALNNRLQKALNPKRSGEPEYIYGRTIYRLRDKIILLNNNYQEGYYNGDLGTVIGIHEDGITVSVMGKAIRLTYELMGDLTLAYAMTIHKSQGSEYANVIISLPFQPSPMLKRNLLYTAVTRAKKQVIIVSENGAVQKSIRSCDTGTRKSSLLERVREIMRSI